MGENIIKTSPVIKLETVKTMTFPEAMQEVINNHKVTRTEWNDVNEYGFRANERLMIHTKGKDHQWLVSSGDMDAIDWVLIKETN